MSDFKQYPRAAIILAGLAIVAGLYAVDYCFSADLRAVQSGEVELICLMKDGRRTIAPEMVTGLLDDTWLFKNGHASARSCQIKR